MKRNLLAVFAVAIAITLSSFSGTRIQFLYLKYVSSMGAENSAGSYSPISTTQSSPTFDHIFNTGTPTLNWLRVEDQDTDGVLDAGEFTDVAKGFPQYDTDSDGLLKDESADIAGKLDLKNKP